MEIGLAHEENGIDYFELAKQLQESLGYKFSYSSEHTFLSWFIDNFSYKGGKIDKDRLNNSFEWFLKDKEGVEFATEYQSGVATVQYTLGQKFFLNGQASKQYLDYVELQDARKNAKQSSGLAIFSIFVAVAAILIGVLQNIGNPKPPYDVKVIEDKTRNKVLQKENQKLKEELYKAEMMVRILEELKAD